MFKGRAWFEYLDEPMKELVEESFQLLEREKKAGTKMGDYGFVVFPIAKAYEGYLKKYLFDMGLINEAGYHSSHFRIGRSLNPMLPEEWRDGRWLYDDVERVCPAVLPGGKTLAMLLWEAWRLARNQVFHYFPSKTDQIDLMEAEERILLIKKAMEEAMECKQAREQRLTV